MKFNLIMKRKKVKEISSLIHTLKKKKARKMKSSMPETIKGNVTDHKNKEIRRNH